MDYLYLSHSTNTPSILDGQLKLVKTDPIFFWEQRLRPCSDSFGFFFPQIYLQNTTVCHYCLLIALMYASTI